jgi:hypothetical protein
MMLMADMGLVYRCNEWKLLDTKTQIGQGGAVPVWVETIFALLDPFILRLEQIYCTLTACNIGCWGSP